MTGKYLKGGITMKILSGSSTIISPMGSACNNGNVCPDALVSECNQTPGYNGQSAKWTTKVQITMGGSPK